MKQCEHKSPRGRACLFDAEPEHDVHMNIGETWSVSGVSGERLPNWQGSTGVLSAMKERIDAEPLDVLGRPRESRS